MFPDDTEPFNPRDTQSPIAQRMREMMVPIDKAIMLTDDRNDRLMLTCAMLQRVRELFDHELGVEGRRMMFKDLA
jgi:hypothetical protein